jgi:MarR family transcriptional regulator for hemolysin
MENALDKSQALGQTLMLIARDFQGRLDRDLAARGVRGIGSRHRAVFLFLGRHGPSRAVELAQAAGIRPQSMMKIVHELESLDLLERRPDPRDSRAKLIDFTASGRHLITELSRSTATVWEQYADIIGPGALEQTMNHLNTLIQSGESTGGA